MIQPGKMSVNLNRERGIIFGNYEENLTANIHFNNTVMENIQGIIIDNKLIWKPHIRHIFPNT